MSKINIFLGVMSAGLLLRPAACNCEELKAAIHVHGSFSHGSTVSADDIVRRAQEKGIGAVVFTDTALAQWEYGIRPLENILRVFIKKPSILEIGAGKYINEINRLREKYPGMVILPGTEAAAYYRWEGRPWNKLIMRDWNRHMLIIGMEHPEDYEGLPVMGNRKGYSFNWLLLWPLLAAATAFVLWKRQLRKTSALVAGIAALFIINAYPFSRFVSSPYSNYTSWEPYINLAAYGFKKNALVFWAHPEAPNWVNPVPLSGRVSVQTDKYPQCLQAVPQAHGFGIFMEGYKHMAQQGNEWDCALKNYLEGKRPAPAWAISEVDFVSPGFLGTDIDTNYIIADVSEKSAPALLEAIRKGRFQAVNPSGRGVVKDTIRFSTWTVSGVLSSVVAGETLYGEEKPKIKAGVVCSQGNVPFADIRIIRNGEVIFSERRPLPAFIELEDAGNKAEKSFYRVMAENVNSMAASNPIFVFRAAKK